MKERYMLKIGERYYGGRIGDIVMMSNGTENARIFADKGELWKEIEWIEGNTNIEMGETAVIETIMEIV